MANISLLSLRASLWLTNLFILNNKPFRIFAYQIILISSNIFWSETKGIFCYIFETRTLKMIYLFMISRYIWHSLIVIVNSDKVTLKYVRFDYLHNGTGVGWRVGVMVLPTQLVFPLMFPQFFRVIKILVSWKYHVCILLMSPQFSFGAAIKHRCD